MPARNPDLVVPDLVVIGGGAIGLATAWRAASAGLRVTLLDPDPGHGASWAAAGMLAPVTEVHYGELPLLALNLASNGLWPSFAAELTELTGHDIGYRRTGTLMVARDTDDLAVLDRLLAYQRAHDLEVERLSSRECRQREPRLSPRIRGGMLVPGDHQVDNRALVEALVVACDKAGVERRAERADEVIVEADRVTGVRAAGGTIACGRVLVAGGCWSASLGGLPPGMIPVRPVKGQLLHLRAPSAGRLIRSGARGARRGPADPPLATGNIRGVDVYLVPRADGRFVVGATVEERGHDTTVTAGAVADLLRDAIELLPDIAELELAEATAGLRPGSPDNAPMIGPAAIDGLVVAAGHYRNGILLTPITSAGIAELLTTGTLPGVLRPFSPRRFEGGTP
jgi:glycine oxidase